MTLSFPAPPSPRPDQEPGTRPAPVVGLRVPTEEDAHVWHALFADPEVMRFHGGRPAELSVYQELTARQRRHDAELGYCFWTVLDAEGRALGFTGAQPWAHQDFGPVGGVEIGWRLARPAWGRGHATAAARITLERLRAAGVPVVHAVLKSENLRSAQVARRLGMTLAEEFVLPRTGEAGQRFELLL
ncbi:GNAT family N-acetyltransferase [Streptomyces sp. NPDC007088]|uniref:GNAT family N-acetyltransferase n=1 Tax=Streptomyces sp. NPDC007088 TaxID=3364773 RepID=UPI003678D1F4